ncbi:hypothetical protein Golomagni_06269 [Golovinomyces magnicellulatus]|nr:hypothetical protein Golomagni_06269 [Golovinomyces magnicellulatus]
MSSLPKKFLSGIKNSDIIDQPRRPKKTDDSSFKRIRNEEPENKETKSYQYPKQHQNSHISTASEENLSNTSKIDQ